MDVWTGKATNELPLGYKKSCLNLNLKAAAVKENTVLPEGKSPGASAMQSGEQDEATGRGLVLT